MRQLELIKASVVPFTKLIMLVVAATHTKQNTNKNGSPCHLHILQLRAVQMTFNLFPCCAVSVIAIDRLQHGTSK